ncbi:MAG: M48 family metallopeptidase [Lentisphaeraceae bacterium]|nr:M48 family metallopeptidase [Lentisphaeraceae bacterium]
MHYEGHAFHESFASGKASGRISVNREGVLFRNDDADVLLPLTGIKFETGGASNRILFITSPSVPGWKLYTTDQSLLKDPALVNNMSVQQQLSGIKKQKNNGRMVGILVLLILFVSGWGLWALKDVFVAKLADQVPPDWEVKLGEAAYGSFKTGKNVITKEDLQADLERIVAPLLKVAQNEHYDYMFHIIEDPTLNAAAFPGGHVIIHTGLILKVEKTEDLLGVLAHEIAHVNKRHSVRQLINTAGLYLVLSSFIGDIGAISGVVINGGSQLLKLHNSRDHEKEADEIGWDYLMKAKINPRGLIDCFAIMQKEMEGLTGKIPDEMDFLSTHPALGNRIKYLEEKWGEVENKKDFIKIDVDYKDFQKRLRDYLSSEENVKSKTKPTEADTETSKDEKDSEGSPTKEQK